MVKKEDCGWFESLSYMYVPCMLFVLKTVNCGGF